jgi:hypothetical protein
MLSLSIAMERENASHSMAPNIEIRSPVDPHLRWWMLFVDGENLTIRAQKLASDKAVSLQEGAEYRKNVFAWFPGLKATPALTNTAASPIKAPDHAIWAYYYTSLMADEPLVVSVKQALRALGFHPEVFKKVRAQEKAKCRRARTSGAIPGNRVGFCARMMRMTRDAYLRTAVSCLRTARPT